MLAWELEPNRLGSHFCFMTFSAPRLPRLALFTSAALCSAFVTTPSARARENWPQPDEAAKARAAEFKRHDDEVIARLKAEADAWAAKGKPFIPSAEQPSDLPQAKTPAFPGAEGGGKFSFGGRGGKVYVVTSLADSGPGTLREAVEAVGPRVVVFNVAGIIHLKMPLFIEAPYLTIAGQTAPGDGICVAGETTLINTHDVVIRYLRFRRGNMDVFDRDDALGGNPVGNIIIDHCSCSWGLDENISMYRHIYEPASGGPGRKLPTVNITIQWTISSESLNTYNHAFGGTWGGRNSAFHHNLFASNTGRNASIGMSYDFNFINNVLFNWRHRTIDGGDQNSRYNIINNYLKPGPITPQGEIRHRFLRPDASPSKDKSAPRFGKAYVAGNVVEGDEAVTANNWNGGVQFSVGDGAESVEVTGADKSSKLIEQVRVEQPFPMAAVTIQPAREGYAAVLAQAGATLPRRDAVDTRVIETVRTGQTWAMGQEIPMKLMKGLAKNNLGIAGNGIITDPAQVGGYPEYKGTPVADLGADGIPASWKNKYKLDPRDADLANKDLQGDGYTVLDKYLNGLDPTKKIDWSDPRSNVNTLTTDSFQAK